MGRIKYRVPIIAAAALLALAGLRTVTLGDNASSRLATVYSLTTAGTWYIDAAPGEAPNPFEAITVDKVQARGRILSSKPPVLPLAMTAHYAVVRAATGWDLAHEADWKRIIQSMCLVFSVLPYLAALLIFARLLDWTVPAPAARAPLLAALAFCTMLPGFATEINNHVPGAAAMLAALYLAIGLATGRLAWRAWRVALFGFFAALTAALDLPLTIFPAIAALPLLRRNPREAVLWGAVGAAGPLALQGGILWWTTGLPLPVQMQKSLYFYENAYWREPGGLDALNEPKLRYAFHLLIGRHGTFLLFPVLLFGLAAPLLARDAAWRAWQWGGLAAFLILTAYYIRSTNNYGGAAYGFRWHLGAMPVLLLMAAPLAARLRAPGWALFALAAAVSAWSAWECYSSPWGGDAEWTTRWLFGPS